MHMNKSYFKKYNDMDFKQYHQVAISMNNYIERLLEKIMKEKGMTNKSQCVRNLIYEEYQRIQANTK